MISIVTFMEDGVEYVSHGVDLDTLEYVCLPQEALSTAIRQWGIVKYDGLGWCL